MNKQNCWERMNCPDFVKLDCPAYLENRGLSFPGRREGIDKGTGDDGPVNHCEECPYYHHLLDDQKK
ncbi:MAG: hypothetical protein R3231_06090 [bacterium]|nr:hypothetical protein [bacterium]